MDKALEIIAGQLPMAVLIVIVVWWLLNRQDKIEKIRDEAREKEKKFQSEEAEKQRIWNEDQEEKRNKFQKEINDSTMEFIGCLQKDQKESVDLLNKSIELVAGKTDLILSNLATHHNFSTEKFKEVDKWRDGIRISKKDDE